MPQPAKRYDDQAKNSELHEIEEQRHVGEEAGGGNAAKSSDDEDGGLNGHGSNSRGKVYCFSIHNIHQMNKLMSEIRSTLKLDNQEEWLKLKYK